MPESLESAWREFQAYSRDEKLAFFCAAFVLLAVLGLYFFIAAKYGQAVGSDIRYHLDHSFLYAKGQLAFLDSELASPNGGPYPPLFHLIFVPFVWLGLHVQFSAFLEAIVLFLAFYATFTLVRQERGLVSASFAIVLLFSSRAFFDRVQVTPQAVDAIAMPLAVLFFFRRDYKFFALAVLAMIYSHGAYGFLLFAPFAVFSLLEKHNQRLNLAVVKAVAAWSLPMILLTLVFLPSLINLGLSAGHNPQDQAIRQDPGRFVEYFGVLLSLFSSLSIVYFSRHLDDAFCRFLLLWIACLLPLSLFFPDRLASYWAQPAAIMGGITLAGISKANRGAPTFFFLSLLALGFFMNYWMWWVVAASGRLIILPLN